MASENKCATGRQRLIDATLICLGTEGFHRSSVRKIAAAAGVTPGLVKYHFEHKREMLVESFHHHNRKRLQWYLDEAAKAGADPAKQMAAFIRCILNFFELDKIQKNIWVNFMEMILTDDDFLEEHAAQYDRYLRIMSGWITGIHRGRGESLPPDEADKLAIGVMSVIDGLWLECALNPSRMAPDDALEIALDMISARIGVSFA
ncbi:MAG: TetR family transcriptional regulator C-terminal domain-containing protein [Nitrospinae bacterium]|nr:TetR family transcriptional regulator C-terminal domain-containing protein [Nitrospinota bacterium]